jgi:hypothetical protein
MFLRVLHLCLACSQNWLNLLVKNKKDTHRSWPRSRVRHLTVATIFAFVFSFLAVFPRKIVANPAIVLLLELLFCGVFPCRVFRGLRMDYCFRNGCRKGGGGGGRRRATTTCLPFVF